MIAIAGSVLHILLVIMLVLLVLLLCCVCIILFLPIKYRANGYFSKEERCVVFQARWLWGILRFRFLWVDKVEISFKVFWKELWKKQEIESKEEPATDKAQSGASEKKEATADLEKDNPRTMEPDGDGMALEEETQAKETFGKDTASKKEKFSFEGVYDKILNWKDKVLYYFDLFLKNSTQNTIDDCKEILGKVLKKICPKKIRAQLKIGFESPDTTGYFYGIYCMFSGLFGKNVVIQPDFDKQILEGEFDCKGTLLGITLVVAALKLYFHKGLRRLIAEVKKGGKKYDR